MYNPQTHSWISFSLNLLNPHHELWLLLGEVKSKCEHLANEILEPQTAKQLHSIYLAKGALATNAIEGNTLTEEEALGKVQGNLELPPSQEYLGQEIDNIIAACNILGNVTERRGLRFPIHINTIKQFNALVLEKLSLSKEVVPGQIRVHQVAVSNRYHAPRAEECQDLVEKMCAWLVGPEFAVPKDKPAMAIPLATIKAILAHLYIAWIHPFGDGNGRTARLVEFAILVSSGVPTPAAHLLSNHYNLTRTEYYRCLHEATEPGGDIKFITYAVQGFVDGLTSQLQQVRSQQWTLAWRNYVHRLLPEGVSKNDRQRRLVLDLADHPEGLPLDRLRGLSSRVALMYVRSSYKTFIRDIEALEKLGVLKKNDRGNYVANRDVVLGMRPFTMSSSSAVENDFDESVQLDLPVN